MEYRFSIASGDCFQVKETSFGIAETLSEYSLYQSLSCPSPDDGKLAWEKANGEIPKGWKQCSDTIPADTIHLVFNSIPGTVFFMKDCTDEKINILW